MIFSASKTNTTEAVNQNLNEFINNPVESFYFYEIYFNVKLDIVFHM